MGRTATDVEAGWVPERLDLEGDQVRQVYATFGAAMYFAQVLEHGLVNFVIAAQTGSSVKTLEEWDALYEELFGLTMGVQLACVLQEAKLGDSLVDRLRAALRLRNRLVHHYFRERAVDFLSVTGRNRMIEELAEMRAELEATDQELEPLTLRLLGKWGLTREIVQAEADRLRAEHRRGQAGDS